MRDKCNYTAFRKGQKTGVSALLSDTKAGGRVDRGHLLKRGVNITVHALPVPLGGHIRTAVLPCCSSSSRSRSGNYPSRPDRSPPPSSGRHTSFGLAEKPRWTPRSSAPPCWQATSPSSRALQAASVTPHLVHASILPLSHSYIAPTSCNAYRLVPVPVQWFGAG